VKRALATIGIALALLAGAMIAYLGDGGDQVVPDHVTGH
jgi:hypothetical protein